MFQPLRPLQFLVIFLLMPFATTAAFGQDQQPDEKDPDILAIERILERQVKAWNEGDIEGFMAAYVMDESLRFASGNTIHHGFDATLERYRRSYPDKSHMGHLRFELFENDKLSDESILTFGRFHLTRDDTIGNLAGLFTILFKLTDDGWKIVSDHTSAGS